jgi:DNA-binding Lrp family transcriptional regulator
MIEKNLFKLDLRDRKILYELDSNARQPCSKIAKKLGVSTEVVNYRIKRLEDEKVITQYQLIINLSKLDILQFKICLSFQHLTSEKLDGVIVNLKKNKAIKWIVSCNGNWDLIISLESNSIEEIDSLKNEVLSLFLGYINNNSISILVEASAYTRDYLIETKSMSQRKRIIMKVDKKIKLDDLDINILKQLSENARKPVIDISRELKSNPRVIDYRIKEMIKNKIILGFKIAINYEKLGIKFYKTFIYLDSASNERIKSLIAYFESNKNIIHHVKVIGNWDLEPEFEVYSENEFNNILVDIKDKFSDIIKNIDIITISKEHKFVYF